MRSILQHGVQGLLLASFHQRAVVVLWPQGAIIVLLGDYCVAPLGEIHTLYKLFSAAMLLTQLLTKLKVYQS